MSIVASFCYFPGVLGVFLLHGSVFGASLAMFCSLLYDAVL